MAETTLDEQFVDYVVKNLVDHPEDVVLERSIDDRGVLLKLSVHPEDMGKVIGKAGSTAKAIRTLLRVVGAKGDERLNLKIVDKEGNETGSYDAAPATTPAEAPAEEASVDAQEAPVESDVAPAVTPDPEPASPLETDPAAIKAKAREGIEDLDVDL